MVTAVAADPAPARGPQPAPTGDERWQLRTRITALLLVVLCFLQDPGRTVPDTKLDLTVDPWGFLGRALQMWDPQGFGGQVQNQATGYLFPVGPFFGIGWSLGLPAWVVQRLWWSLVLVVAFLGVVRLARALGIGSPGARVLAGVAFALSPRMLSSLGPITVEVLPMALAAWAVLPLVGAGRVRSVRRAAALSGLAVLCMGGVNAAATFAAVLPAALWVLLVAPPGQRRRLWVWWSAAVLLASVWWAVPLVLLGRFSSGFLDYIETASSTTSFTSLVQVLRGTSHWVTFLTGVGGPERPAGWMLLTSGAVVLASLIVVGLGLAGLARRDLPQRHWLVACLLTGLVLVMAGHVGSIDSPLSLQVRQALDGALSPLRNVHKFDPLLRLALVLGLCHVVSTVRWSRDPGFTPAVRRLVGAVAALAVVVTASPALAGRLPAGQTWEELPAHWSDVATYLAEQDEAGRALLVPASQFGTYEWGDPRDEPLQPLADSPWIVRDVVPLVPAGHIRLLDAVEEQLRSGRGSPGLAELLRRAGISHVVVRNDLDEGSAAASPARVAASLRASNGLDLLRSFGPVERFGSDENPRPPVQVYGVAGRVRTVQAEPLSDVTVMTGGPESLLPAIEQDLAGEAVVLAAQLPELRVGRSLLTDGLRRREVDFGSVRHTGSAVLTGSEPLRFDRPVREYELGDAAAETVAAYQGVTAVRASSSASDVDAGTGWIGGALPYSAADGDVATEWVSGASPPGVVGQYLELELENITAVSSVQVRWGATPSAVVRRLRVETDGGATSQLVAGVGTETVPLPGGVTRRLRLTVEAVERGAETGRAAIAELQVAGVDADRLLVVPALPASAAPPDAISLVSARDRRPSCLPRDGGTACRPGQDRAGEEDVGLRRSIDVGEEPAAYDVDLVAVPRPGERLDALLGQPGPPALRVLGTSTAVPHPLAAPEAAFDGDNATSWLAAADDPEPGLVVGWLGEMTVSSLRLVFGPDLTAPRPSRVVVSVGDRSFERELDEGGVIRFPPVTTSVLTLDLAPPEQSEAGGAASGLGVSEVVVPGLEDRTAVHDDDTVVDLPCGTTPTVELPGQVLNTAGSTTFGDLRALRPVEVRSCEGVPTLPLEGRLQVRADSGGAFFADALALRRLGARQAGRGEVATDVVRWSDERRVVDVGVRGEAALLVVAENVNKGWRARVDGRELDAVTVAGWQQGFIVPAGPAARVELEYEPGSWYRAGLGAGVAAVALLLVLALVPGPPGPPVAQRSPGRLGRVAAVVLVLAALALLAGAAGAAAWGLVVLAVALGRRWSVGVSLIAFAAIAVAGVALALRPWASQGYVGGSWFVNGLCLVAVAAACLWPPVRSAVATTSASGDRGGLPDLDAREADVDLR